MRARVVGEDPGVLLYRNQDGSRRRDFDGGKGGGGRRSCVGRKGNKNVAENTDGSRVTNIILGT